jgi:hypothetical protein
MASEPSKAKPSEEASEATVAISRDALDNTILENALYMDLSVGRVIRLIELLPGSATDPVVTRMSIHELEFSQDYEAISYVWGDASKRKLIKCNGATLSITASLEATFRRLRYRDRSRIVWADAMCINQGNIRERSHHVAFMDKIYRRSQRTLVHMGKDVDGGAGNVADLVDEHVERMSRYKSVDEMPMLAFDDPIFEDDRWRFLAGFMRNVWFRRLWVLQETGVSAESRVYYGRIDFSYRDMMQLCRWIMNRAPKLQTMAGIYLVTIHQDWEDWGPNWAAQTTENYTLLDLLSHAKGQGCKDPHDHVYALLGHPLAQLEDGSGPIIKPDYTKPVGELYQELTVWMLKKLGLGVLSAIEHDDREVKSTVPSWVVQWNANDLVSNSMGYYSKFYYRASGPELPVTPPQIQNDLFRVKSIVVDTVLMTYPFPFSEKEWETTKTILGIDSPTTIRDVLSSIWADIHHEETPSHYLPDNRVRAFSLSLCTGLANYIRAEDDVEQHDADFSAFWKLHQQAVANTTAPPIVEQPPKFLTKGDSDAFCWNMSLGCTGRSFFITEKGYYGLGPWITKPGDECVILSGARVPFVVYSDDGKSTHKILGEAYIHGLMHGEYLKGRDIDDEWIDLVFS